MRNVEELRSLYVGKEYFHLTVVDVVCIDNVIKLKCQCKCGNTHFITPKKFGVTKSCGCYQKSDEYKCKHKEWLATHKKDLLEKGKRYSKWCKDHPNELAKRNANIRSSWTDDKRASFSNICKEIYANDPDKVRSISDRVSLWWNELDSVKLSEMKSNHEKSKLNSRLKNLTNEFLADLHKDDLKEILLGNITVGDNVRTRCQNCGSYEYHSFCNVFHLKNHCYFPRLCSRCYKSYSSSSYEDYIYDYIKTFYSGKCIRNSRNIISPLELDLYYPEKKIAVEFNGNYWHSKDHKSTDYHINKFIRCYDQNIILVSVFELDWRLHKDDIKSYLKDLFNGIENKLSFNDDHTLMNNNYPLYKRVSIIEVIPHSYTINSTVVNTCGFSKLE